MYGTLVKIVVKPGKRDQLIKFLRWDAAVATDSEPGTVRFDVWEVPRHPDALYLYEAYVDREAFARHQANEPYKRFVQVVEPELIAEMQELFEFTNSLISNID